jgi:predicted DNA-binding transcriptional regulator YafY
MLEVQTKVKRQIELLGIALNNTEGLKDADFAVIFDRDIPTIKRDMQELRSLGINIHSEKKQGICVAGQMEPELLRELITQYTGICNSASGIDKATALLVKMQKEKALHRIVMLQRCIEGSTVAIIDYQKDEQETEHNRELCPLMIFSSEGQWRVLAVNNGKIKQYLLNKILDVRLGTKKFSKIPQEKIVDMFRYSFRSWVGSEQHKVKIHLSKVWADRIKPRHMVESEVITKNEDGSVVFEATVNSLEEVASWVVTRGAGVKVLEPKRLEEMVVGLAKGALANYSQQEAI